MFTYIRLPPDAKLLMGDGPTPNLSADIADQLRALALRIDGIQSVQLPHVVILPPGIATPDEPIALVKVDPDGDHQAMKQAFDEALALIVPDEVSLKVLVLPGEKNPWK